MATSNESVNELLAEWETHKQQPEAEPEQQATEQPTTDEQPGSDEAELSEWEKTKQRVRELGIDESISAYESQIGELRSEIEARDGAELLRVQTEAWEKAADSLLSAGANVDRDVLKNALLGEYLANEDFRDAFDNSGEHPQGWNDAIEAMAERLPRRDGGLIAAVRAAATITTSSNRGDYDGIDWGNLSDAEFAEKKQQVFADSAAGKLQQPYDRGWGKFA